MNVKELSADLILDEAKERSPISKMQGSVTSETQNSNMPGAWKRIDPVGPLSPLLLTSPHSGSVYPKIMQDIVRVPIEDLAQTEDAFVDELFDSSSIAGAVMVNAVYARAYVDLNRDSRELDPDMIDGKPPRACGVPTPRVEAGLGCLPRIGASGEQIYARKLTPAEVEDRLWRVHDSYHGEIRRQLMHLRDTWGEAFLLDCHSMPSQQPGRRALPDIVLGDRFGSSCTSRMIGLAERTLRNMGYSVARNAPYAGGYTTRLYGRPKSRIHALQIEINRKLYMHERSVSKSRNFEIIQRDMAILTHTLAEFARSRTGIPLAAE